MIIDAQLEFSAAQAVTAAAISTNVIDLGPLATGNLGRDIGTGERLIWYVAVTVAMTDASSDSTITATLESDVDAGLSTSVTNHGTLVFPALSPVGTIKYAYVPPGGTMEQYLGVRYTPANGNLTTGSFTSGLVRDADFQRLYANGYSVVHAAVTP